MYFLHIFYIFLPSHSKGGDSDHPSVVHILTALPSGFPLKPVLQTNVMFSPIPYVCLWFLGWEMYMEDGISGTVHCCAKIKTITITVIFNEIKRINNNQKTSFAIFFYNRFVFVSLFCESCTEEN